MDEITKTDRKIAIFVNTSFSTIINNLNNPEHPVSNSVSNDFSNPVLKSILKHIDHPIIKLKRYLN